MTAQEYLTKRVQDQIQWYDTKSTWNQQRYKSLKLIVIVLSVSIPFLTGLIDDYEFPLAIVVGAMGVTIALIEGILSLYKYQEHWIEYRKTAEQLTREQLLFNTQTGPYADDQTVQLLVDRCETIMGLEHQKWLENQKPKAPKKEKKS